MDDGLKKLYEEQTKRQIQANTNHELEMINQQQKGEPPLFKDIDPHSGLDWDEKRMDIIGQNGNDGDHYSNTIDTSKLSDYEKKYGQDGTAANNMACLAIATNGRWNWYGVEEEDAKDISRHREMDAAGMDDDDPNPKEGPKGNYEL